MDTILSVQNQNFSGDGKEFTCCYDPAWMKNGGLILWNATAFCEVFKTSWQMGEHLMKGDLENHSKGPVIPIGSMVGCRPISAKDQSGLHQFGKEVLPGKFLRHVLHAGRIGKGDMLVADVEELENVDTSDLHARRLNAKEIVTPKHGENFIFPIADGTVNCLEEIMEFGNPPSCGTNPQEPKSSRTSLSR